MHDGEASVVSKESWEKDSDSDEAADACPSRYWAEILTSHERPGLGLHLACEKAKHLSGCNRQALFLLLQTSKIYESYSQALLKAAIGLQMISTESSTIRSMQNSVTSISSTYAQLAKTFQQTHIAPLHAFFATHDEAVDSILERYRACRHTATIVHKNALAAYKTYTITFKDVHAALSEWKNQLAEEKKEAFKEELPRRLVSKLSTLREIESKYKRLVKLQSDCLQQSQRMETMALESTRNLYEDRLILFSDCLVNSLHAMIRVHSKKGDVPTITETPESSRKFLAPVRKHSLSGIILTIEDEEESGAMDAETLGLSEDIGKLRDEVRGVVASRAKQVHNARVMSSFLDCVALASTKLSERLYQQVRAENNANESKCYSSIQNDMTSTHEASMVLERWSSHSEFLEEQATRAKQFADVVGQLRSESLDWILDYGEQVLKPAADRDNATWNQLCDAARSQSKAELQYNEATIQTAKVRERCKSNDSAPGGSIMAANKHVSQSLANVFSILPYSGEHAMGLLDASTRASIAQLSLDEANQKESKGRLLLDSARELTLLSLEAYTISAKKVLTECQKYEPQDYDALVANIVESVDHFSVDSWTRKSQEKETAASMCAQIAIQKPFHAWLSLLKQKLDKSDIPVSGGFTAAEPTLTVHLEHSILVRRALSYLGEAEIDECKLELEHDMSVDDITETEADENGSMAAATTPLRERAMSAPSNNSPKGSGDETSAAWLLRSLTLVDGESIFGRIAMTKKTRSKIPTSISDREKSIFAQLWPEEIDEKSIPTILHSFACSFKDGGQRFPCQYGRTFVSDNRVTFVSWTQKQISLKWGEVKSLSITNTDICNQEKAVAVMCQKDGAAEESCMVLGGLSDARASLVAIERIKNSSASSPETPTVSLSTTLESPEDEVHPDETIKRMEIVLSNFIRNVSVQRFYDLIWSEGNGNVAKPFYRPWLEKENFDVEMGDWVVGEFEGPYCREIYSQKRVVTFKTKRKTHLYIGPPIANVKQTQYCRLERNNTCIMQMTVEFDGIPYADAFAVEIRWVAKQEKNDVKVEVAVEVDFKKSTFLKSKIRSGTIEETTPVHVSLFEAANIQCGALNDLGSTDNVVFGPEVNKRIKSRHVESSGFPCTNLMVDWTTAAKYAAVFVLSLLLAHRLFFVGTKSGNGSEEFVAPVAFISELAALRSKIDGMQSKMEEMQNTLNELLSVAKEMQ